VIVDTMSYLPGSVGGLCARDKTQARDGADAGESFATKAKAHDLFEVVECADFTCGMAAEREWQVVLVDTDTVVTHTDEFDAALFEIDLDTIGLGIQTVFEQFLDD
jgi:hypothetical protein